MTISLLRRSGRPSRVTTNGEITSIIGEYKEYLRSTIVESIDIVSRFLTIEYAKY